MIIIILVRVLRFSLRFSGGMSLDITYNYYPYLAMNEKLPIFFLLISNQIMSELLFCNIIVRFVPLVIDHNPGYKS